MESRNFWNGVKEYKNQEVGCTRVDRPMGK